MRTRRPIATLVVSLIALAAAGVLVSVSPAGASGTRTVSLSMTTPTVTEGNAAVVTVSFTGAPATSDVIVNLKTVDGTAKSGSDYTALNTSVRFHPGDQTPKTVSVATTKDFVTEGNETFSVIISSARNAAIGTKSVTITLTDSVPAPSPFSCEIRVLADDVVWKIPPVAGATTYDLSVSSDTTGAVRSVTIQAAQATPDPTPSGDDLYALVDADFVHNNGQFFHGSMHTVVNGVATDASDRCYYIIPG